MHDRPRPERVDLLLRKSYVACYEDCVDKLSDAILKYSEITARNRPFAGAVFLLKNHKWPNLKGFALFHLGLSTSVSFPRDADPYLERIRSPRSKPS